MKTHSSFIIFWNFNLVLKLLLISFLTEGLKLLGHHFQLFSKRIMENHSWWHFVIRDYLRSPNREDYIIALEISDLYYRKVAELLSTVPCQIPNSGPVLDVRFCSIIFFCYIFLISSSSVVVLTSHCFFISILSMN